MTAMHDAGSNNAPIFVVGTPRSGTTLTAKILGSHSCLFMPGETHFFDDIYSLRKELGEPGSDEACSNIAKRLYTIYDRYYEPDDQIRIETLYSGAEQLARDISDAKNYGQIFDFFMKKQAIFENKLRWGNNAPRDIFSIHEILKFFPNAKIIVCVRDVRAFLLSYKGKWKITGDDHVERLKKLYHPVVTSYLWKSSMMQLPAIKGIVPANNFRIIKYEDLVTAPEATMKGLCQILEIDFELSMLEVETHNSSNAPTSGGIFSSSIDKWKDELSPEEINISQRIAAQQLDELGYSQMDMRSNVLRKTLIWLSTPFALVRGLHANRATRGPLIPYLLKRVSSLVGGH